MNFCLSLTTNVAVQNVILSEDFVFYYSEMILVIFRETDSNSQIAVKHF